MEWVFWVTDYACLKDSEYAREKTPPNGGIKVDNNQIREERALHQAGL
jgi:hypothetical protein